jgi:hypothetical protein
MNVDRTSKRNPLIHQGYSVENDIRDITLYYQRYKVCF